MEKDAYYFPHFCNAKNDRKILRVRKELGVEGYGIFFMLLETLRDQADFKYPLNDVDLLADEFGTSEQKIRTVVCNYNLFDIDQDEHFFSPKLIVYLQPYFKMREQRRLAGIASGKARHSKQLEQRTTVQRELNENEQSKVKESKVKESKIYNNTLSEKSDITDLYEQKLRHWKKDAKTRGKPDYPIEFIKMWDVYPRQEGKKAAYVQWVLSLVAGAVVDELQKAAIEYQKECTVEHKQFEYMKQPATFFGSREYWRDYV